MKHSSAILQALAFRDNFLPFDEMVEWMSEYDKELRDANAPPAEILDAFAAREARYTTDCHRLIENFCRGAE